MSKQIHNIARYLASIEVFVVALIVLASMVSEIALPWAIVSAVLYWLIRWAAYGRPSVRTPADCGVIGLLIMVPITLWATALPDKTIPQVLRLISGILLFYAIVNWGRTVERVRLLVWGAIGASLGLGTFAMVSVEWGGHDKLRFIPSFIYDRFAVLVEDTVHTNVMAGNLVILLPLALALLFFAWKQSRWWERISFGLASIFSIGILILTQSRGAIIALICAFLLQIVLRWRWGWLALPLAALTGGLVIKSWGLAQVLDMLSSSVSVQGAEGRVEVWSRSIYMIQDFSFTGIGIGSFMDVADLLYPFFLSAPGKIEHAHNLFLQVAVDMGIPGLIAWLSVLFVVILSSWQICRCGRETGDGWVVAVGVGLLSSQLALSVHGIVDAVTWGMVRPAPILWAVWGIAIAARRVYSSSHLGDGIFEG